MTSTMSFTSDDILEIIQAVWAAFLPDSDGVAPAAPQEGAACAISANVTISGSWNGVVSLGFSGGAAALAASTMFGIALDDVGRPDIVDAVGELVNIIGGNIKGALEGSCDLSLPLVVEGRTLNSLSSKAIAILEVPLEWMGEGLEFSLIDLGGHHLGTGLAQAMQAGT